MLDRVPHVLALALAAACAGGPPPADESLLVQSDMLNDLGDVARGVTIDADGQRYVLGASGALFRLDPEGPVLVWRSRVAERFEDVVALEPGAFALTTRNMGYVLHLETGSLEQHFCYLPDEEIREEDPPPQSQPTHELARAVTYDRETGLLYAQPQTVRDSDGRGTFSEVASFDRVSGEELAFRNLGDARFSAGGIVVLDAGTLLAGEGSALHRIDFETGLKEAVLDLSPLGVEAIEGMAIDDAQGQLLVVEDGVLHTLDLARLAI